MVPWNKTNEQIYEYQCQELNYDMYHWLHGAREREKRGEKFDPNAPEARGSDRVRVNGGNPMRITTSSCVMAGIVLGAAVAPVQGPSRVRFGI